MDKFFARLKTKNNFYYCRYMNANQIEKGLKTKNNFYYCRCDGLHDPLTV